MDVGCPMSDENTTMENYLQLIRDVVGDGLRGEVLQHEGLETHFVLNAKVGLTEIEGCKVRIPEAYQAFLSHYNGGILYRVEDLGGFKFFSVEELQIENEFQQLQFADDWDSSIILFGMSIADNEYLGFRFNADGTYNIIDCVMIEMPSEWNVIGNSFEEFMAKVIESKGKKYWLFA